MVVLRILRTNSNLMTSLGKLGMYKPVATWTSPARSSRRPHGIFLVTGPTGSGKTTTLYSALDVLNQPDRKIITAEDPVEYNFTGINQCQVRDDIGLTFAKILRAMLRQAPNIVLVGEIRDKEVADVATQAALTGHLVFSTLHTNDAPSAITRMIDMGVKPFLVASSLQAVMAQRLIRVLCKECKAPDENPSRYHLKLCGITDEEAKEHTIYKAVGCPSCNNSGYRGRQAVFEFMQMNTEIRELAFKRAAASHLRKAAIAGGHARVGRRRQAEDPQRRDHARRDRTRRPGGRHDRDVRGNRGPGGGLTPGFVRNELRERIADVYRSHRSTFGYRGRPGRQRLAPHRRQAPHAPPARPAA